jgi:hypothetical protein
VPPAPSDEGVLLDAPPSRDRGALGAQPPNESEATVTNAQQKPTDITEFGRELWDYLTGKGAVIEYTFEGMQVEVPKTTGPESPRATWKLDGTLRIRTSDKNSTGSIGS